MIHLALDVETQLDNNNNPWHLFNEKNRFRRPFFVYWFHHTHTGKILFYFYFRFNWLWLKISVSVAPLEIMKASKVDPEPFDGLKWGKNERSDFITFAIAIRTLNSERAKVHSRDYIFFSFRMSRQGSRSSSRIDNGQLMACLFDCRYFLSLFWVD